MTRYIATVTVKDGENLNLQIHHDRFQANLPLNSLIFLYFLIVNSTD